MKQTHTYIMIMIFAMIAIIASVTDKTEYTPMTLDVEPLEEDAKEISTPYPVTIYQCEIADREEQASPQVQGTADIKDAEMIAKVMHAEANNQDEKGKRLVCDVILNRVDSASFPDSIKDVIIQPNQFAKGIICTEDDIRIVQEEMTDRTDSEITFFRTGEFHKYGIPAYQYGDHYFNKEGKAK